MFILKITKTANVMTTFHTATIEGLKIFYREAGAKDKPAIVLLHGYPTSSQMYQNLMTELSDQFHLVAPDFPGLANVVRALSNESAFQKTRM
jgi:pimeloyl-ACP methyl ester carboxylesterase